MIHILQHAIERECKRMSKGFDHNAERAQRLRFYKNIAARPRALVVSAVSQNDHILLATTQLCCEILHLDTFCFFACFSWISFFWGWTWKRDHIDHGPGYFKAESNRECLILSVAVCNARRLCNQACELDIWRKDAVSDHIPTEVHPFAEHGCIDTLICALLGMWTSI